MEEIQVKNISNKEIIINTFNLFSTKEEIKDNELKIFKPNQLKKINKSLWEYILERKLPIIEAKLIKQKFSRFEIMDIE